MLYPNLLPHTGQNFKPGVVGVLQREHVLLCMTRVPQAPQKLLPGAKGLLQLGHSVMSLTSGVPQLIHLRELGSLSVPHLGHGLYGSPHLGQKRIELGNLFEQFEQ